LVRVLLEQRDRRGGRRLANDLDDGHDDDLDHDELDEHDEHFI
jgi:hypothetical protein